MNVKDIDFRTLTGKWVRNTSKQYLYVNKDFNEYGIDYEHFIQLRFQTINESHINKIYKIEGWFLLWHLMCQAKNNQCMFLETTINIIYEKINKEKKKMTAENIKKYLLEFHKLGVIKLNKVRDINVNTHLQIFIAYNNDEYYPFQDEGKWKGYRALPVDFVQAVLDNVSPEEWAVFSVLCTRYRYWQTAQSKDNYGNIYYNFFKEHYAFPTMENIGESIGRGKSQVSLYVDKLANNPLELIKVFASDKSEMRSLYDEEGNFIGNKRKNYIYYISIFERVEWIYQNIVKQDKREDKIKKKNIKNFSDIATSGDYYTLTDSDYLMAHFGVEIKEYKKALETDDAELYKACEKRCNHENGTTNLPQSGTDKVIEVKFDTKTG